MRTRVTFIGIAEAFAAALFVGLVFVCLDYLPRLMTAWGSERTTAQEAMLAAYAHAVTHPNPKLGPFNLNASEMNAVPISWEGSDAWLVTIRDKANNRERKVLIDGLGRCRLDSHEDEHVIVN